MAEIKIQRKRRMAWWPFLLILLIPLAWYLLRGRRASEPPPAPGAAVPARSSAIVPAAYGIAIASRSITHPSARRTDV